MILSEWRKTAPNRECLSNKVLAVLKPVLADLGADGDPDSWIVWGDDPAFRYSVMTPTPAGLIVVGLRLGPVLTMRGRMASSSAGARSRSASSVSKRPAATASWPFRSKARC